MLRPARRGAASGHEQGRRCFAKRFQLTSHPYPYHTDSAGKTFVARNLETIRWDLSLSSWTVTDDGYLQIIWSTGYAGYGIKLGWSKGSYRGTAHYWTDTDPQPLDLFTTRNSTAVHVDRVEFRPRNWNESWKGNNLLRATTCNGRTYKDWVSVWSLALSQVFWQAWPTVQSERRNL
jgi:hypothetical protein